VQKKKYQEAFTKYMYKYKYKIKIIQSKTKEYNIMRYIRFGKKIIKCALTFIVGGVKKINLRTYSDFVLFFPTISTRDGINK
jgi:hypothetical protein